mmetsp:Transcript_12107/g.35983  ORF Transcript_12107/g.35983 Transcript_12107/m.35983 type:complete len:599 (-) Transcript_12107:29-1825(-)|eukprot:CAMPEP_0119293152 /NCGR_PEP_ID=MMETSP1329-20130426/45523_1 /TAXON_ID=114041 /ORGANISM="Genus nov. species nov., Strain RCC1024" /LENGTH=598 /DNA_ID=CAMNT_0007294013 /DNA_START=64 /DNA_END=1860 /DNA_ORIENTATION=+
MLSTALRLALLQTSVWFSDAAGDRFKQPRECDMTDGLCTLTLGVARLAGITTRGYNGGVPGPIVRTRAGEALRITVKNELTDKDNEDRGHNVSPSHPNTTNLHVHGLHVSSKSPADSVFVTIPPQGEFAYEYELPPDHMGGTFWYHTHFHGSTAIQTGGGAAGLLIVEDEPGAVPPEVEAMEEVPLMLTFVDLPQIGFFQSLFNLDLWQNPALKTFMRTNDQDAPTLTVFIGTWYRLRVAYTSSRATTFPLAFEGDSGCEMHLLAKDGTYLNQAPRFIEALPLVTGGRADVAVRCSAPGLATLGGYDAEYGAQRVALNVRVPDPSTYINDGNVAPAPDLPQFVVDRPCYLADTRAAAPDASLVMAVKEWEGDDAWKEPREVWATVNGGELVEVEASTLEDHPLHIHVNHFQLTDISAYDANYYQPGDWHDTIQEPSGAATLRFYTDRFGGDVVAHCHNLAHGDKGQMQLIDVRGEAFYAAAEALDPACYRDSSRGWAYTDAPSTSRPGASLFTPEPEDDSEGSEGGGGGSSKKSSSGGPDLGLIVGVVAAAVVVLALGACCCARRGAAGGRVEEEDAYAKASEISVKQEAKDVSMDEP